MHVTEKGELEYLLEFVEYPDEELLKPPIGEGRSYDAHCKDIRPALDWSLEKGWTVPRSQTHRRAAQMKRVHLMMMKSKRGNRRKEHRILHKKLQSDSYRCHNGGDSEAQLSIQIIGP
uniref:Uncharacterized protein n=1 Tax=Leersia perrieri TaxID=77586 RepID=A0A0D9WCJ8_9ORYZ